MKEPVIVIHGVANRDAAEFTKVVNKLRSSVGSQYDLIEVFWGDLGGNANGLQDTLPIIFPQIETTYGESEAERFFGLVYTQRQTLMSAELTQTVQEPVIDALYHSILHSNDTITLLETKAGQDSKSRDDLYQVLIEEIPATQHLKNLEDPELRQAVGDLIAEYLEAEQPSGNVGLLQRKIVTRGWTDTGKQAFKNFIGKVDNLIGKMVSNLAGVANQRVRSMLAEPIALTLGDIVAYHQRRHEIHKRLFNTLDERAPGYGTADKPITVMAHSLGGLVTFDAALGSDIFEKDNPRHKLHIKHWITFGSQPAFFHVLAPRKGIEHYTLGKPVHLPASIGSWTNLWHPMDMLAFSAASVFRLSKGNPPVDVRIDTPASEIIGSKGWLHSSYWGSPQLVTALKS